VRLGVGAPLAPVLEVVVVRLGVGAPLAPVLLDVGVAPSPAGLRASGVRGEFDSVTISPCAPSS
jgi:hypothetical protein